MPTASRSTERRDQLPEGIWFAFQLTPVLTVVASSTCHARTRPALFSRVSNWPICAPLVVVSSTRPVALIVIRSRSSAWPAVTTTLPSRVPAGLLALMLTSL